MKPEDKRFIYRLPLPWLEAVMQLDAQARGQTKLLNISLAIWYLAGLKKEIRISPRIRGTFHISRGSVYRNLALLSEAGLITVSRRLGKSPVITGILQPAIPAPVPVRTERALREERMEG